MLLLVAAVQALKAMPTNATYKATWASVDAHNPAPEWFQDAKFGIYFHWGIFSVPAHYNEWYPRWSQWSNDTTGCYTCQTNTYGYPAMSGPPNPIFPYQYFINGGTNKAGQFVQFAPKLVSAGGSFDPNAWGAIFADAGTTSLTKIGTGTLILTGANTYSGNTTISGGRLIVNNSTGSGTGFDAVTVASGGALGGGGIISGVTTVSSGGMLSPGNSPGVLTFSNSLTLNSSSTNIFEISKSPLTNDAAKVLGALTCGGTLIVTNIGATALAAGDRFKLFNAASYSGAFASVILPSLPAGLGWNTNALNTAGTLSVVVATAPVIQPFSAFASGGVFAGTGGVANASYYLLTSSNLAVPSSNWPRLLTNQFDESGNFNFTNPPAASPPPSFYRL